MLQFSDLKSKAANCNKKFISLWGRLDHAQCKERLEEIEHDLSKPGAWDKPDELTPVLREKSILEEKVASYEALSSTKSDVKEWLILAAEDQDQEILETLSEILTKLSNLIEQTELATLLSNPEDKSTAILEIHPGAGGVEAQDWAEMLLRMYMRWCEKRNWQASYLDLQPGDEAGIKSVTIQVKGLYAYGFMKGEAGIHRLIRISPYDASGRRHTSFASVDVYPEISHDIEIEVKDDDIRLDVFRASGPGGQHVNKTNSAVRITHLPTNIVVQCQNEKSQLKNKETAMKVLKSRLYEQELKRQEESKKADYSSKDSIAWGSQIKTYTLQPYRLVKDHRCGAEDGNVDAVLDGELDDLVRNYLLHAYGG
ncbi:peptide chain release factor 2 [Maridesulfovibrio ferrireducens]|uniref:peptide chain release factor 2 n=1 Tax=Maridesulfovibrio ferrireducens TaxID=246191 RepID=UPI001B8BFB04|nr:peptide chain release factor 2 [Maridesulfovibrio ferrireducens]